MHASKEKWADGGGSAHFVLWNTALFNFFKYVYINFIFKKVINKAIPKSGKGLWCESLRC